MIATYNSLVLRRSKFMNNYVSVIRGILVALSTFEYIIVLLVADIE